MDDFVKNKFEKITESSYSDTYYEELCTKIADISNFYDINLRLKKSPYEILKEIVIATNYSKLVQKEKCNSVAGTLELLEKGFAQIEKN